MRTILVIIFAMVLAILSSPTTIAQQKPPAFSLESIIDSMVREEVDFCHEQKALCRAECPEGGAGKSCRADCEKICGKGKGLER